MWVEIGVPVIAALSTAAVGRWMVPGRARRIGHAKAEAELLQLLPDGGARDALAEKLQVDVLTHVKLERNLKYDRLRRLRYVTTIILFACLLAMVASLVGEVLPGRSAGWVDPTYWATMGVFVVAWVLDFLTSRAVRVIKASSQDEAQEETTAAAGATGHLDLFGGQSAPPQAAAEGHINLSGSG